MKIKAIMRIGDEPSYEATFDIPPDDYLEIKDGKTVEIKDRHILEMLQSAEWAAAEIGRPEGMR